MFGNVDNQTAYSLLGRLRSALCSSEKDLPLVDAMPALAKELQRRQATLQQAANIPNATAMSIIDAVLTEATSMTADASTTSHTTASTAIIPSMREETYNNAILDPLFKAVAAQIQAQDLATPDGRRNAIGSGFTGSIPLMVRVLLTLSPQGDDKAKRNNTLSLLNDLRPYRMEYFNWMLTVNRITGTLDPQLAKYRCGSSSDSTLFDSFMKMDIANAPWVSAPHGLLGYQQALHGKPTPDRVLLMDAYAMPEVIDVLGPFGQLWFTAIGVPAVLAGLPGQITTPGVAPVGFTWLSFCEFYATHIRMALRCGNLEEQVKWLVHGVHFFRESLILIGQLLYNDLFSGNPKSIDRPLLPWECEPIREFREKQASLIQVASFRKDWELFAPPGGSSSPALPRFGLLPLLSSNPALVAKACAFFNITWAYPFSSHANAHVSPKKLGKTKVQQQLGDNLPNKSLKLKDNTPPTAGAPPGSAANQCVWLAGPPKRFLASGWKWDIKLLAAWLGINPNKACWAWLLSLCAEHNKPSRCVNFGKGDHKTASSPAHVWPANKDFEEAKSKFAVRASAEELALIPKLFPQSQSRGRATRGRGREQGRGRGKGRDGRGRARGGYYDRTVEFDDEYVDPLFAEMEEDEEEEEIDEEQLQLQYFRQPPVD